MEDTSLMCKRLPFSRWIAFSFLAACIPIAHDVLGAGARAEDNEMSGGQSEEIHLPPTVGLSNKQEEGFYQALVEAKEFFTLTDRGDSLLADGKIEEAITEYKRALGKAKLKADALYVHDRLAKAYEEAGRYEEALREVREISRIWPHEETKAKVLKRMRELEKKIEAQGNP
jgi:tetratricopeptide (TPR) repeat protein